MSADADGILQGSGLAHATHRSYVVGLVLSIALTGGAYLIVSGQSVASDQLVTGLIVALAIAQFLGQLVFFLHLGSDGVRSWRTGVFASMVVVTAIFVLGTAWIMSSLNSHMSPSQQTQYMQNQGGGI